MAKGYKRIATEESGEGESDSAAAIRAKQVAAALAALNRDVEAAINNEDLSQFRRSKHFHSLPSGKLTGGATTSTKSQSTERDSKSHCNPWPFITGFMHVCVLITVFILIGRWLFGESVRQESLASVPPLHQINLTSTQLAEESLKRLELVAKEAASSDDTVIVIYLPATWQPMLDLFLQKLRSGSQTYRLIPNLLIVSPDPKGYENCRKRKLHCYFDPQEAASTNENRTQAEMATATPEDLVAMGWRRQEVVRKLLRMNLNVIATDADVLWFQDPSPYLGASARIDMAFSCDTWSHNLTKVVVSTGFFSVRSSPQTRGFYDFFLDKHEERFPGLSDQAALNLVVPRRDGQTAPEAQLVDAIYLERTQFAGFCQPPPGTEEDKAEAKGGEKDKEEGGDGSDKDKDKIGEGKVTGNNTKGAMTKVKKRGIDPAALVTLQASCCRPDLDPRLKALKRAQKKLRWRRQEDLWVIPPCEPQAPSPKPSEQNPKP